MNPLNPSLHPFRPSSRNSQTEMVTAAPPLGRTENPVSRPRPVAVPAPSPQFAAAASLESPDLLTMAKAGDQAAFAALIRRHQNMVFSVALHMLRSRPAAEDLAQEVFLELYRSLGRLESDAHVVSWLRRVASHRCIDEIRRRNHRQEFATDTLPEPGHSPQTRDVFGAERCMVGSDMPIETLSRSFAELYDAYDAIFADGSDNERSLLFGGTAARVYGAGR